MTNGTPNGRVRSKRQTSLVGQLPSLITTPPRSRSMQSADGGGRWLNYDRRYGYRSSDFSVDRVANPGARRGRDAKARGMHEAPRSAFGCEHDRAAVQRTLCGWRAAWNQLPSSPLGGVSPGGDALVSTNREAQRRLRRGRTSRNSLVVGDCVVELAGLEPTTRLLWVGSAGRRISRRLVGGANSTAAKK